MAKIIFPKSLNVLDQTGMVRSIVPILGTKGKHLYEFKITLNEPPEADKNMYIGLTESDMNSIIYHLKALKLIKGGLND